ncbi:MAG: hypothetical protein K4305_09040 [Chlorobium sp.]|uniref:hypothetical protein n=1 Tax=Chlorobium sp. TaxID=1095 RepID=UPI002F3F5141
MARIIYPDGDGIAVIIPAACGLSINEIARKDVPAGLPYKILEVTDVPADRTFRDAWEADFTDPDGYGIGSDAWFAEQAAKQEGASEL